MLDDHRAETTASRAVHDYLEAAERHVQADKALEREARDRGIAVAEHPLHAEWRKAARPLLTTGRAILADEDSRPPIIVASGPRARPTLRADPGFRSRCLRVSATIAADGGCCDRRRVGAYPRRR